VVGSVLALVAGHSESTLCRWWVGTMASLQAREAGRRKEREVMSDHNLAHRTTVNFIVGALDGKAEMGSDEKWWEGAIVRINAATTKVSLGFTKGTVAAISN
jgi:hypothetical protein